MIDVRAQFPITPGWPRLTMDWNIIDGIVIHHTAVLFPAANMTRADELNHIRVIHDYHESLGWGGFAYHFIVFPSGRCYYVVDLHRWGAHVGGLNDRKFGIVAAGNFIDVPPDLAQFSGVWHTLGFIDGAVNPDDPLPIYPHRAFTQTSCPGKAWPLPEEEEMSTEDFIRIRKRNSYLAHVAELVSFATGLGASGDNDGARALAAAVANKAGEITALIKKEVISAEL